MAFRLANVRSRPALVYGGFRRQIVQPQIIQFFMPELKFFCTKLAFQRTRFYMFFSLKAGIFSLEH
ncbi:hypothetical protein BDW75DRAFT_226532 [Aspergillus navahoensis]